MGAGTYREIIKIQSQSTSGRNEYGEVTSSWVDFLTTRASFEPLIGREFFSREQVNSQVEAGFRIRYRTGIKSGFRVLYRNDVYEILYEPIDVGGRHRELLIYCKKVV